MWVVLLNIRTSYRGHRGLRPPLDPLSRLDYSATKRRGRVPEPKRGALKISCQGLSLDAGCFITLSAAEHSSGENRSRGAQRPR